MSRRMSAARLAASRALQLITVSVLVAVPLSRMRDALPLPTGFSIAESETWLRDQGPVVAAFALLRGVALLAAGYAAVIGLIGLLAVLARSTTLAALTVRLTLPALRPLLAPVAVVTLSMGSALPAGASGFADPPPRPPVMRVAPAAPPDDAGAPVMRLLPAAPVPNPPSPAEASYTVAAGDTFWSIAAETVQRASGRAPTDAQVAPYWRVLIDANRDRLAVPGDPDLIYPGQVFTLPQVS